MKIVLHAPTASALVRARSNLGNLRKRDPAMEVRIVLNGDGVGAALDAPEPGADAHTLVCGNTLERIGRSAQAPLTVLPQGAVLALATLQAEGWTYIRA